MSCIDVLTQLYKFLLFVRAFFLLKAWTYEQSVEAAKD